jgi:hypothetical protein
MDRYLSDPAVIAALHVKAGVGGQQYRKTVTDLRPLYLSLIKKYRVLIYRCAKLLLTVCSLLPPVSDMISFFGIIYIYIYICSFAGSGDVDACVPYYGSEEWTRELGLPVKQNWRCVAETVCGY